MTFDLALFRQGQAFGVGQPQIDPDGRTPGLGGRTIRQPRRRDRARRRQLGHAPACLDGDVEAALDTLHQGRRQRRAAHDDAAERRQRLASGVEVLDQAQPYRRHADGDGDVLRLDQPRQAGPVGLTAGQHQLGADRRHGERQPPGIGVEHRHHDQHAVGTGNGHDVDLQQAQGMQEARAMGIGDALGRARRPRGEAQARRRRLVEPAPVHPLADLRQQGFQRFSLPNLAVANLAINNQDMGQGRRAAGDLPGQRHKIGADDQNARLRLRHHLRQLPGGDARVQRMADRAHAHDGVPRLDMCLGVPGQGRHAIAAAYTQTVQQGRDTPAARHQIRIADPVDGPALTRGDHLGGRVPFGRVRQELVECQRERLHRSVGH